MPQGHNADTAEVFKMLGQEGTWRATQVYTVCLHHRSKYFASYP